MYSKKNREEMIKNSHERSRGYGIEKERVTPKKILEGSEVSTALRKSKKLMDIAAPFMQMLYNLLQDSGFILLLTDKDGCILNIIGDNSIVEAAKALNMIIGAYMDEGSIGTNAMGTAIKEDSPIQISAKEHFITAYHRWTCSAAPIHDTEGNIIGTLNLTGGSHLVHPHTLGMVVAAVKFIENQFKVNAAQKKLNEAYNYMNTIMDSISSLIIAIDREGIINSINDEACKTLNVSKEAILNSSIESIIKRWKELFENLEEGIEIQDEEIYFAIKGVRKRYNMNAYPILSEEGNMVGAVILLKDIENVIKLVNKYSGMNARYTFEDFIGESYEIKRIKEYAKNVANSPSTILIEGESGTGKEVLAQSIHNYSHRKNFGFVAINCGAISKNLIESELFGYEEGAFTGAKKGGQPGKFELANGGTLFLDEIGEMPLEMQVNLLRVLQEGVVTRVGGNKYIPVNVRIIAATNKDLRKEVARGTFRQDLYYRLSVIPIIIPPLRERKEDIKLLIQHFLKVKSQKLNKDIPVISQENYFKMINSPWEGNVRELENFIEKVLNLEGSIDFEFSIKEEQSELITVINHHDMSLKEEESVKPLWEVEKNAIIHALDKYEGNISKASEMLCIGRNTLYNKIRKYNIN
ncbi:Transcriptional regulator containing PAS, AAA-type ATPase, and DNA-binding Fis domains [Clostridium amylolyticum]|uniref:Transcriptional regulator containing PAS, AAA-type ATPase, and DNA-binding Fis domains n=2 Tax=Clostridium amylolyticum TaxID=1121298 RepID=A0A1M6I9L1_9CLOT|nr:Transcriptional regulator containing PAS, AAA-type ATPase, and DNA-binding Fis domains [Clostridium amylolyticum]